MIDIQNVTKSYATGVQALNGVTLHIDRGEFVFIVGNSGSGKSTLIKLLLKELDPSSGTIKVNGIKTPWTLESEYVWKKTHAMGGVLFCIMGILLILSGVFPSRLMTMLAFGFILAGTLWLYVYSWLVYRKQSGS